MSKSLYRIYRSRDWDDIVGQKHIVEALKNAVDRDSFGHSFLFVGPRGVGKTSIARILAHKINNVNYSDESLPIDIIEIDAASNRGIDEIRDLREKVKIAPVNAKYKVYIIDEVHMLTTPAFNALLKTLEEPPSHVVFIMATTEAHKVPDTIVSRSIKFNFKLASLAETADHLEKICKAESISIDKDALMTIAKHSGGSLRDALSLLDQVRQISGTIGVDVVRGNLGLPSDDLIHKLYQGATLGSYPDIIRVLDEAESNNLSANKIAQSIYDLLKADIAQNNQIDLSKTADLLKNLSAVEYNTNPYSALLVALLNYGPKNDIKAPPKPPNIQVSRNINTNTKNLPAQPDSQVKEENKHSPKPGKAEIESNSAVEPVVDVDVPASVDIWSKVLDSLRKDNYSLYNFARMAEPDFDGLSDNNVTLYFKYPLQKKVLSESKNKEVLAQVFENEGLKGISLELALKSKQKPKLHDSNLPNDKDVNQQSEEILTKVQNVFGDAEEI